jgi:radical SAM family protein/B12 binding protein
MALRGSVPFGEFTNPFFPALTGDWFYPIGLAYVAAALEKEGISVDLFDAWAGMAMRKGSLPAGLSPLKSVQDLRACRSDLIDYYEMGSPLADLERRVRENAYPVVGLTSMFSGHHLDALKAAAAVKKACPGTKVVMGGHATTSSPELTLGCPDVDYIVLGEGEEVFPRLARFLLDGDAAGAAALPGVGSKAGGRARINAKPGFIDDLDALARPTYQLADPSRYKIIAHGQFEPHVTLFTSRGCPHLCDFCTIYITMGRRFRAHSPRRVVEDIRHCLDRFGVKLFYVEDDNFAFDPKRAKAILRLIIKEFGARRLTFRNHNGMTALSLNDAELVSLMAEAGFDNIAIALESDDPGVRRVMKKPGSVAHFTRAAELCRKAGIMVGAYTILGLPYSSLVQDIRTQLFCLAQNLWDVYTPMYYPIPLTPQHEKCVQKGWIDRPPEGMALLRSDTFPARRPDYSRRAAFTLAAVSRILWSFKKAAASCVAPGESLKIEEVFERHRLAHPYELSCSPGGRSIGLRASSPMRLRAEIEFAQAEHLYRRGELLSLREAAGLRASFSVAKSSPEVLRRFLAEWPSYPMKLGDGSEIRVAERPDRG